MQEIYTQTASPSRVEVNKVLRNTYMLLGLTLLFSARAVESLKVPSQSKINNNSRTPE